MSDKLFTACIITLASILLTLASYMMFQAFTH